MNNDINIKTILPSKNDVESRLQAAIFLIRELKKQSDYKNTLLDRYNLILNNMPYTMICDSCYEYYEETDLIMCNDCLMFICNKCLNISHSIDNNVVVCYK